MKQKRVFSSNWSKLTDEQVLKNVRYLIDNREKYHKYLSPKGTVKIDNISILKSKNCYCINYRPVFMDTKPIEYYAIDVLYNNCRADLRPFDSRAQDWWNNHKKTIKFWGLVALVMFVNAKVVFCKIYNKNKQELKLEQQKMIHFNDSLKHNAR